jgi:hypothetical protein
LDNICRLFLQYLPLKCVAHSQNFCTYKEYSICRNIFYLIRMLREIAGTLK